jgi:hypothetical protein
MLDIASSHPFVRVDAGQTLEEGAAAAIAERDVPAALAYLDRLARDARHQAAAGRQGGR